MVLAAPGDEPTEFKAHVEPCIDWKASIAYCQKEPRIAGPWRHGTIESEQGKRSDILELRDALRADPFNISRVVEDDKLVKPMVRMASGARMLQQHFQKQQSMEHRDVKVFIVWGKSGVGKSYDAMERAAGNYFRATQKGGSEGKELNFDAYDGETTLILDDFRGSWCKPDLFLLLCDKYPLKLNIKYGHCWARWTTIFITSNSDPNTWWAKTMPLTRKQFWRRIYKINGYKMAEYADQYQLTLEHTDPADLEGQAIYDSDPMVANRARWFTLD